MADFSSAALVGLIIREMTQAGLTVPPDLLRAVAPGGPATVSVDTKRMLLAEARMQGGPGFLLRIGQGIHAVASDPTLDALRRAADPFDLLQRWLRLEKYHHSHHRTEMLSAGQQDLRLRHVSLDAIPPTADEDLVVLGLLAALLQSIGCRGIDTDIVDGDRSQPAIRSDRVVLLASLLQSTGEWRIGWSVHAPRSRPVPASPLAATIVDRLYALLDDDPLCGWTIAAAARRLAHSPRSLQRHLHEAGASFSGVVRDARVKRAARSMGGTAASLAEIGYASGFSDQAHFTREFRRITGMAPAEWRRLADSSRT